MKLETFEFVGKSENRARLFIRKNCWKKGHVFCTACGSYRIYRLLGKRYRCPRCKNTFHDFTGRWVNEVKISFKKWLWVLKFFELEISARKIAEQTAISYPTVLKATHIIRQAIYAHAPRQDWFNGEIELDESYFGGRRKGKRGRGAAGKVPVFGILERNGKVNVEVVSDVKAQTLLNLTVKMVRRGSIVYTDKFRGYDALMFCGYRHVKIDHKKHFSSGKVYINGVEGFWSFAKERLIKFHGVSKEWFPFYLKEMEFRYNHRHEPLFELLMSYITNLVPNRL